MHNQVPGFLISFTFILTGLLSTAYECRAQSIKRQVISSFGSSAVISENLTISQSAGQSYNTTSNQTNGTISQGFQQPPSFVVEELKNNTSASLDIMMYPNPASHSITLTSKNELANAWIQVADVNGKLIHSEKIANLNEHKINCAIWANGIYFITIQDASKNSKSLRLIISK